jgi:hypothetical protein
MHDYFDNRDEIERNLDYLIAKHGEVYRAYEHFGVWSMKRAGRWMKKRAG